MSSKLFELQTIAELLLSPHIPSSPQFISNQRAFQNDHAGYTLPDTVANRLAQKELSSKRKKSESESSSSTEKQLSSKRNRRYSEELSSSSKRKNSDSSNHSLAENDLSSSSKRKDSESSSHSLAENELSSSSKRKKSDSSSSNRKDSESSASSSHSLAENELSSSSHTKDSSSSSIHKINDSGISSEPNDTEYSPKESDDQDHEVVWCVVDDYRRSRDEVKASEMGLPIDVSDIINLPVEELMELEESFQMDRKQVRLCREIRKRGKNKVAAQNCRKRKTDQIDHLQRQVDNTKRRKHILLEEREELEKEKVEWTKKVGNLEKTILNGLDKNEKDFRIEVNLGRVLILDQHSAFSNQDIQTIKLETSEDIKCEPI